ncbi:2-hydroxymuconate tautomerase family protein [Ruegeria pomeroyi]|nr:2-hydroxymuconate tautomerase family protein [Ruegeria pomeroyi]
MPYVKIEMLGGRDQQQKRALVASVTEAVCTSVGCNADAVWVVIDEKTTENWGAGGKLIADKAPS